MDLQGLSAICAGLGIADEDDNGERIGYTKSEYCLDNLKDLQRFLRRDDPQTRDVFKQVCKWNIVGKDLVPIIEHCQDDRSLIITAVKVLVFLTMPIEPTSDDISQQIEYLWELKASVTRNDTIAVIITLLEAPLENLERESFSEEDWKMVQLLLTLFRNLLAIQDISTQQKASGCATRYVSLRDRFLELLFTESIMDLILALTHHVGGSSGYLRQDNLLFLEIYHYIFLGQEPDLIVKASLKDTMADEDVKASVVSLKSMMEEENDKRRLVRQQILDRHSQFSGTFTRLSMDGSKSVLKGNPGTASRGKLPKPPVVHRGPIKRIVGDYGRLASSKEKILGRLHDFIDQFLSGGYNELMQSVREDIGKEHPAIQKNDIVVFFQVAQFIIAFQRQKFLLLEKSKVDNDESEGLSSRHADKTTFQGDMCGPIAATMNEAMFFLVISKWRGAFEGLKETNDYKSLSAAGSLMKNMIRMLDLVLKFFPDDSKETQTARILLYKLFYDQTEQGLTQFLVTLIKSFNTRKQPKSDLAGLVEMIHIVVRLMEKLQARGTLRVSKKSRRVRKKKASNSTNATADEILDDNPVNPRDDVDNPPGEHTDLSMTSKEILEDNTVNPQDDADNLPCKQPKDSSMTTEVLLEKSVSDGNGESTLGPAHVDELSIPPADTEDLGDDADNLPCKQPKDSSMTTEVLLEKSVSDGNEESTLGPTHVDEPSIPPADTEDLGDDLTHAEKQNHSQMPDTVALETDDSSDDDDLPAAMNEVDFQVSHFVFTFANNTIIQNLCWLLKYYKSNSVSTNHYIISIFRRICDDLELSPMLYQLSLLTTFYDILAEQKSSNCKDYKNIVSFISDLVRKMMRKMKSQPLLFVEVLFWKTRKECHYISSESMLNELGEMKKQTRNWGTEDHETTMPSEDNQRTFRSIADSLGDDDADVIVTEAPQTATCQEEKDAYGVTRPRATRRGGIDEMNTSDSNCEMEGGNSHSDDSHSEGSPLKPKAGRSLKRKKRLVFDQDLEMDIENLHENEGSPVGSKPQKETKKKKRAVIDQELETDIKNLYEKYKDQKKCNHLIATALLEAGRTLSVAQVSRKIKQLGLRGPQKARISKSRKHLRDADAENLRSDERYKSDDETLFAVKKRSKTISKPNLPSGKDTLGHTHEKGESISAANDSEDEVLSSLFAKSGKRKPLSRANTDKLVTDSEEARNRDTFGHPHEKGERISAADDSEDEVLSSLFTKSGKKKPLSRANTEKLVTDSVERTEKDSTVVLSEDAITREGHTDSTESGSQHVNGNLSQSNLNDGASPGKKSGRIDVTTDDIDSRQDQELHKNLDDDLGDDDDDVEPLAPSSHAVRRKLKMVIDDDE